MFSKVSDGSKFKQRVHTKLKLQICRSAFHNEICLMMILTKHNQIP